VRNVSLLQDRESKQAELKAKKIELNQILDKSEKQKAELKTQIRKTMDEGRRLQEEREREDMMNAQKQVNDNKRLNKLNETLKRREQEASKLRQELQELNDKEKTRIESLENEKKKLLEFISDV